MRAPLNSHRHVATQTVPKDRHARAPRRQRSDIDGVPHNTIQFHSHHSIAIPLPSFPFPWVAIPSFVTSRMTVDGVPTNRPRIPYERSTTARRGAEGKDKKGRSVCRAVRARAAPAGGGGRRRVSVYLVMACRIRIVSLNNYSNRHVLPAEKRRPAKTKQTRIE